MATRMQANFAGPQASDEGLMVRFKITDADQTKIELKQPPSVKEANGRTLDAIAEEARGRMIVGLEALADALREAEPGMNHAPSIAMSIVSSTGTPALASVAAALVLPCKSPIRPHSAGDRLMAANMDPLSYWRSSTWAARVRARSAAASKPTARSGTGEPPAPSGCKWDGMGQGSGHHAAPTGLLPDWNRLDSQTGPELGLRAQEPRLLWKRQSVLHGIVSRRAGEVASGLFLLEDGIGDLPLDRFEPPGR